MSAIRVSAHQPRLYVKDTSQLRLVASGPSLVRINACPLTWNPLNLRAELRPPLLNVSKPQPRRLMPICLAGGRGGTMDSGNQRQWTPFESAQDKFKGQSIEDILREQIEKKEYFDDRGNGGGKPPRGSGGEGNNNGGSEGEGFAGAIDEIIQVVLATIGFIVLYISLIDGQELTKLAKDYLRYLITGNKSVRLKRAMYKWERFYKRLLERKGDNMLDGHEKYRRSWKSYMVSNSDQ